MFRLTTARLLGIGAALTCMQRADCFLPATTPSLTSRATVSSRGVHPLRVSEDDREREDLKLEQFDKDVKRTFDDDSPWRGLWEDTQSRIKRNQMMQERVDAKRELKIKQLRYVLEETQDLTGLPLLDGEGESRLAWAIKTVIALVPFGFAYIVIASVLKILP